MAASAADVPAAAAKVVAEAAVIYKTTFAITCTQDTWTKVLDNPELLGRLWELGAYAPAYKVSVRGDTIHVDDPAGLAGDFVAFVKKPDERQYWGTGKITHKAVPLFNTGQLVAVVRFRPDGPRIVGSVEVFVKGDSLVARGALWAGRLLIQPRVENRVNSNLADATTLIETLVAKPENGLKLLQGKQADQFRALFMPPKPAPAPRRR